MRPLAHLAGVPGPVDTGLLPHFSASGLKRQRRRLAERWVMDCVKAAREERGHPGSSCAVHSAGGRVLAGAFFSSGRFSTVCVTVESSLESMSGVVGPPDPQDWTSPCLAGLCYLHPHPPCCRGSRRPRPEDAPLPPPSKPALGAQPLTGSPV